VAQLSSFSPYILGSEFTAADCIAYVHFLMIRLTTEKIYGENMLDMHFPQLPAYMHLMDARPHIQRMLAERETALTAFVATNVKYDG